MTQQKRPTWLLWAAVALLLALFGRLQHAAARQSATFDETIHIFYGALYWSGEPLRPVVQNPPLINAWMGLPVHLALHPTLPTDHPLWSSSDWLALSKLFLWEANPNGLQMVWVARTGVMWVACLLAALVVRWLRQWTQRPTAALLGLAILTADPNFLAHSHLATVDLGVTAAIALAVYLIWRAWRRPRRHTWWAAGVALGLALAAKFSGLVLLPALALILPYRIVQTRRPWRQAAAAVGWLPIAAAVVLIIYRGQIGVLSADLSGQFLHLSDGHSAYLLGRLSRDGWWYYFPIVLAAKTPLPTLALWLAGAWFALRTRTPERPRLWPWSSLWPWLTAGGVLAAAMVGNVNLGYRYLLPMVPLLIVASTAVVAAERRGRLGLAAVAGALTAISLAVHPHYLAYFNQAAGGSRNGWRIALDSNYDWGQDVGALGDYVRDRQIADLQATWLGTAPPAAYGFTADFLPGWPWAPEEPTYRAFYPPRPAAGVYALSASQLWGVYARDPLRFAWFHNQTPTARIGRSIFLYDVPADGSPVTVLLSGIELDQLLLNDYAQFVASNNVRLRWYDAREALVRPADPAAAVYIVGSGHQPSVAALQAAYAPLRSGATSADGRLTFDFLRPAADQPEPVWQTAFRLTEQAVLPPARWVEQTQPVESAVFGGMLRWEGYVVLPASENAAVHLLTRWTVVQPPTAALRSFVHWIGPDGALIAQHDGWGVHHVGLQPGDTLVQLHTIPQPTELAEGLSGWQVGLYTAEDGARLTVTAGEWTADRLLLDVFPAR